ncbi:MAG: hypothetical protein PHR45_08555 [Muribaculaceae bacterium]|nr:hypothetical protein [Muribaculaceae bacterium]
MNEMNNAQPEEGILEQVQPVEELPVEQESPKNVPMERLIDTLFREPKIAHFIGSVLEGKSADEAAGECFEKTTAQHTRQEIDEVLRQLNVPGDEFENLAGELSKVKSIDSTTLRLIAKGLDYDRALRQAEDKAYIKGRNERIALNEKALNDSGDAQRRPAFVELLKNQRRSVWDE